MESGASISPTAAVNTVRWSREEVAQILDQSDRCRPDISQRQFARQADIPRSTVQFWVQRREQLRLDPLLARFLESPVGVAFLQRMLLALHLVFEQDSTCGLRKIAHFLELTQLDRVVAASYGAQQAYATGVTEQINEYGRSEQQRLAAQMPARQVTVCEDETFHPEICLVAIEPVSGFIVLEAYRDQRDTQTWNTSLAAALSGVPVTVIQTVSDEASALKAHARDGLGAHHSPDLFHVQQELSRAVPVPWRPACDGPRTRSDKRMRRSRPALQSPTPVASNARIRARWRLSTSRPRRQNRRATRPSLRSRRVASNKNKCDTHAWESALTIIPSIWAAARRATQPTRSVSWRRASTRSNDWLPRAACPSPASPELPRRVACCRDWWRRSRSSGRWFGRG